jgi:hypothetical protein
MSGVYRWIGLSVLVFLFQAFLDACTPALITEIPVESSITPTATPTPTATIVWFPPTSTPTPFPTRIVTPTQDLRPDRGEVLLTDDFSTPDSWLLGKSSASSAALGKNELTIAISEPGAYQFSVRQTPVLNDFYAEITASPTLCRGKDEYGLLIRMASSGDFYRFSLSCDGQVRMDRVVGGTASSPQPWTLSGSVPPGAPSSSRLAVWAEGKEMRFFVNDEYQFTVNDPLLPAGNLGVFARSAGQLDVTVSFTDLIVYDISH